MSNKPKVKSAKRKILTLAKLRQVGRSREVIEVPLEIDGEEYIIFTRQISLGLTEMFASATIEEDLNRRSAMGILAAKELLTRHMCNEDGSDLPHDEVESTIDEIDAQFAATLTRAIMGFVGGGAAGKATESDSPDSEVGQ